MGDKTQYRIEDNIRTFDGGAIYHAYDVGIRDEVCLMKLRKPEHEAAFISAKKLIGLHIDGLLDVYDTFEDHSDYCVIYENKTDDTLGAAVKEGRYSERPLYVQLIRRITEIVRTVHDQGFAWNHFSLNDIVIDGKNLYFYPPLIDKENPSFENAKQADTNTIGSILYLLSDGKELLKSQTAALPYDDQSVADTIKLCLSGAKAEDVLASIDRIPLDRAPEGEVQSRTGGKLLWIFCGVLGVVIVILAVSFFTHPFTEYNTGVTDSTADNKTAVVPNLVGMTEEEARKAVTDLGVGLKVLGESTSNETAGTVTEQDISVGTSVDQHTTIGVYISAGPQEISIPDVTGKIYPDAVTRLQTAGFTTVNIEKVTSPYIHMGYVVSMSTGTVKKQLATQPITISVSIGTSEDQTADVEIYQGMTEDDAARECAKYGIFVSYATGQSDRYQEGEIMAQNISPSMRVPTGTYIVLTVCEGPPETEATMSCQVSLTAPSTYLGGPYLLTLEQTVDDILIETTVETGDKIGFPYALRVTGRAESGTLHLYEADGEGNYVSRATWEVTFS